MTIITNAGKKIITHAILNKLDLFISKVVYADCNLDVLNEDTVSLTNIKYENLPTSVRIDEFDNSKIILEAVLRNDTAQDFFINCVGFIAKNGELLCFSKTNRTFVQSVANNTNASLFHYKLVMKPKNAKDLNIKIDETIVYPTLAHFNASQKAQDELINAKVDKTELEPIKTDITNLANTKANKSDIYTKTEIDTSQNTQDIRTTANEINTQKLISDLALEVSRLKTAVSLRGGVGMIYMFSGLATKIPKNFILCDGRELLKTAYPQLFGAIGTIYGESADKLKFKIPDLRGCFTRCVGGNAGALGTKQGDAIRNITGTFATTFAYGDVQTGVFTSSTAKNTGVSTYAGTHERAVTLNFNANSIVPTANENRPVNMAMNYVIQVSE